ncbi:hypothetical protein GCM10027169_32770 [Gordonia jinhuaensis]|uniref:Alpha/beta hydrolase family protein n=1 Tax=Gordonia jinhuaensis TaxID=1517702 RepID=A0A916WUB0_9ACTN|nr:hypothetical protein [Gordonia jinhuaensis]GGB33361.1 hypothetical protein GCM10011489_21910 [Gordonia jinhuaensis]
MFKYDWRESYLAAATDFGHPSGPSILKTGRSDGDTAVILIGGKEGTANGFNVLARNIATLSPNIDVWSMNRREAELADTSYSTRDLDEAVSYYVLDAAYQRPSANAVAEASSRGLVALVNDIKFVVDQARACGKSKVLLGGHSVGAAAAAHFASWDFAGTPGYDLIDGLILIDGGIHDAFAGAGMHFAIDDATANGWLAGIESGAAFEADTSTTAVLGFDGPPESAAIFYHVAARLLLERPQSVSPLLRHLPAQYGLSGSEDATNMAVFHALNTATGPGHSVTVAGSADLAATAPTRLGSVAHSHAIAGGAFQWYTSNRTLLDYIVADSFRPSALSEQFGFRNTHGSEINIPVYSFASAFTNGSCTQSAQWLAETAPVPELIIDSDDELTHHDLLWADLPANTLVRGITDFANLVTTLQGAAR